MSKIINDEALIKRLVHDQSNQDNVLGTLFESYSGKLFGYLKGQMNADDNVIEDIIQDTFITASSKISALSEASKFYSCIVSIARNKMIDYIRQQKKFCDIQEWFDLSDSNSSDENSDDFQSMEDMLSMLEQEDQDIVLMKVVLELSFIEIAEVLSISVSASKMRYYRCLDKLKEYSEIN